MTAKDRFEIIQNARELQRHASALSAKIGLLPPLGCGPVRLILRWAYKIARRAEEEARSC